jgi:hypothetical protein
MDPLLTFEIIKCEYIFSPLYLFISCIVCKEAEQERNKLISLFLVAIRAAYGRSEVHYLSLSMHSLNPKASLTPIICNN